MHSFHGAIMQFSNITTEMLFKALRHELGWLWLAGHNAAQSLFDPPVVQNAKTSADLVGYLSLSRPRQIQVLGEQEIANLQKMPLSEQISYFKNIVALCPAALIVANLQQSFPFLMSLCDRAHVPLLMTQESAAFVIDVLHTWLAQNFAQQTSMHGVFMDTFGMGVLLLGESGLGKSELGLELISRGHGLVADDVVDFSLIAHGVVEGRCPPLLENLLEVRGIGLLDIRAIFGETAMRRKMKLGLIVHLVRREAWERDFERLPVHILQQDVLGVPVRKVMIPVEAGRNIAVLVEAAVRNAILQMQGTDTFQEFLERQRQAMKDAAEPN